MGVFRRPELEKDNPVAPQMYVGPRRRRALARAARKPQAPAPGDLTEMLQNLTAAAARFVAGVRPTQKLDEERTELLEAIAQAQRLLSGN
ncbi:MAG: hypothetical protein RL768_2757 [Nitrospirota bacterium]|jgi:hypothetical protein|nr:hypothetical protein [Nitrospira sp.]